jgi:hypothetical protein
MFRKIACVLILFSFLLVKNTPLLMTLKALPQSSVCQDCPVDDTSSESEKENKELKSFDDFIHQPILYLNVVFIGHKLSEQPVSKMIVPYISKHYTPPDLVS